MDGRRGKMRLIPIVMAAVLTAQMLPVAPAQVFTDGDAGHLAMIPSRQAPQAQAPADEKFAYQQLDEDQAADNAAASPTQTLQGSVTTIKVVNGRSQIVKFAQPIMRASIANPQVADLIPLAPDQFMINGKQRGVTSLIVWDENGQEGIFDLYVQNDTSELMDAIAAIAPNEKIQARVTDDSFILSGQVSNTVILDEIRKTAAAYGYVDDKFIDLTETPVPQVVLEVKIAEANRTTIRSLSTGVAWNNLADQERTPHGISRFDTLPPPTPGAGGGAATPTPVQIGALPVLTAPNVGGLTGALAHTFGKGDLAMRFDALDQKGKINVLANPTLVCTHGREAEFLAGGEFPFVGSVDQNGSPVIEFKEFGVKLKFTPWIAIRSGRVELHIENEVSSLDTSNCQQGAGGLQVCGLLKRTTKTTVELVDGDSLMISGILSREERNTMQQTPWIGSVPILGNLFKNGDLQKFDRELVVIVTPKIVKPNHYGKYLGSAQ